MIKWDWGRGKLVIDFTNRSGIERMRELLVGQDLRLIRVVGFGTSQ